MKDTERIRFMCNLFALAYLQIRKGMEHVYWKSQVKSYSRGKNKNEINSRT